MFAATLVALPARCARSLRLLALGLFAAVGCARSAVPLDPDSTRALAPVPACVQRWSPAAIVGPTAVLLNDDADFWQLVFAPQAAAPGAAPASTRPEHDCTGFDVLAAPELATGHALDQISPGKLRIVHGSGRDRLQVAWFQSHRFDDGSVGGPLALVRGFAEHGEVYGVGVYRSGEASRVSVERLGKDLAVSAIDDRCSERAKGKDCRTTLTLFQPRRGRLVQVTQLVLEEVTHRRGAEAAMSGEVEDHFRCVHRYEPSGVRLLEELTETDQNGRELRRAELERFVDVYGAAAFDTRPSLWQRRLPKGSAATAASSP